MIVRIVEGKPLISLEKEEVMRLCRPGAGADTCIWLVVGTEGFECLYYNRGGTNLLGETLEQRWREGKTVAKRDGCPEIEKVIKSGDTIGLPPGYVWLKEGSPGSGRYA